MTIIYGIGIFQADSYDPIHEYLYSQVNLGNVFANIFVLLGVTYGKSTKNFHMDGITYMLSALGFILIISIFAQSVFMVYPNVKIFAEFMRERRMAIIFNLVFFADLVTISFLSGTAEYTEVSNR